MAAPQFPSITLPAQPNDPNLRLPAPPDFPLTLNDVLTAIKYCRNVDSSNAEHPPAVQRAYNNHHNTVLHEHGVAAQAAAAGPQGAIQQLQDAIQQLCADLRNDIRAEIMPDLRRLMNQSRLDGTVVAFKVVPFTDGSDPTQPPNNLPPLHSVNAIENLNGHDVVAYLVGYGVVPPAGTNPHTTNYLQKDALKLLVGCTM